MNSITTQASRIEVPLRARSKGSAMLPTPDRLTSRSFAISAMERIEGLLQEETAALRTDAAFNLEDSNNRKSRSILDFNNAMRGLAPSDLDDELRTRLMRLRHNLSANLDVIKLHLRAAQEVSSLLTDTVRDADSDGTYSRANYGARGRA